MSTPAERQEAVARDRWGRYLLPDPQTGEIRPFTRTTTLAGTITDTYGIHRWELRGVARGLATSPRLVRKIKAADPGDRDVYDEVIAEARKMAGLDDASELGTAIHGFTEVVDLGEDLAVVPTEHRDDVAAYRLALEDAAIRVVPGWVERIVINSALDVAGTVDRLVAHDDWPRPRILDVKTGHGAVKHGGAEIATQLYVYASAEVWYEDGRLHDMPEVDQEVGMVAHTPAGTGTCQLYEVDLSVGAHLAQLCRDVRKARNAAPLRPYVPVDPADAKLAARVAWLRDRVRALPLEARRYALRIWPQGVPRKADDLESHDQVDAIVRVLDDAEAEFEVAFGPVDPTLPPPEPKSRKSRRQPGGSSKGRKAVA